MHLIVSHAYMNFEISSIHIFIALKINIFQLFHFLFLAPQLKFSNFDGICSSTLIDINMGWFITQEFQFYT